MLNFDPAEFGEMVVYLGIGTFVKKQIPDCLKLFCTPSEGPHAKVYLFDPEFRLGTDPLVVTVENANGSNSVWKQLSPTSYLKGNLMLVVMSNWVDSQAKFFSALEEYLLKIVSNSGLVIIGVLTQPYVRVEENEDVINIYHTILAKMRKERTEKLIQYFHLCDYADRSPTGSTLVWWLNGKEHDQDLAVLKEVVRYKGAGISFGVSAYAQFPGVKYNVQNARDEIDYQFIQEQVEADSRAFEGGDEAILSRDECDLAHFYPLRLMELLELAS